MLSLIVAMDENRLIGRDNGLPWRLPSDMAFFKRTTMGKPVVMGRKTYESIGKPLPGRDNVVITRQVDFCAPGCTVVPGLAEAIEHYADAAEIMIMGGVQIYRLALDNVDRLYVTRVHGSFDGDAWFPEVDWSQWRKVTAEDVEADERNAHAHTFEIWERISK